MHLIVFKNNVLEHFAYRNMHNKIRNTAQLQLCLYISLHKPEINIEREKKNKQKNNNNNNKKINFFIFLFQLFNKKSQSK